MEPARLNFDAIRAQAARLGLSEDALRGASGVWLRGLESDRDQRTVTLTVLARLSRVLDLSLDELVDLDSRGPEPPAPATASGAQDAHVVLALLALQGGVRIADVLDRLGWDLPRLDSALAVIADQLSPTALRVAVTDDRLTLLIRTEALPEDVRRPFDELRAAHRPLSAHAAVMLLRLVYEKVLAGFPEGDLHAVLTGNQASHGEAIDLIARRVALALTPLDQLGSITLTAHPDALFALGLADEPAADERRP
ncbi:putative DNA-binding protein [Dietzia cinnamea P4]|nr:putative DNA-binding protein [Dietzia cinnamea P4]